MQAQDSHLAAMKNDSFLLIPVLTQPRDGTPSSSLIKCPQPGCKGTWREASRAQPPPPWPFLLAKAETKLGPRATWRHLAGHAAGTGSTRKAPEMLESTPPGEKEAGSPGPQSDTRRRRHPTERPIVGKNSCHAWGEKLQFPFLGRRGNLQNTSISKGIEKHSIFKKTKQDKTGHRL